MCGKEHTPFELLLPDKIAGGQLKTNFLKCLAQYTLDCGLLAVSPTPGQIKPTRPRDVWLLVPAQNDDPVANEQDKLCSAEILHDPAFCLTHAGCTL